MLVLFSLGEHRADVAEMYDKYADMLYRIALVQLGASEDAEDAVQDVFTKYLGASPSFRDSEHEKAWFIRVTVNRCHDIFRRNSKRSHLPLEEAQDITHTHEDETDVTGIVHALPEKYRAAVTLHYLEGFSVEETARLLKLTVSAVKMRLARGREKMKEIMSREEG